MLTIASPPLKGGRGDVLFEGSPRAGAAEYVQRGDVNNKEQFAQIRYAKVIKKYQSAKKKETALFGGSLDC